MDIADLVIKPCTTLDHFDECLRLQMDVWGLSSLEEQVPRNVYAAVTKAGGQCLGAFHKGRMIGFSLAFVGRRDSVVCLHLHMIGVSAAYRHTGVGTYLMWAQREYGIKSGYQMMEWTFDPFETANARTYIGKLGGVVREFLPNFYGITSSELHGSLPTDRLLVEWNWNSPRVQALNRGSALPLRRAAFRLRVLSDAKTDLVQRQVILDQLHLQLQSGCIIMDAEKIINPDTSEAIGVAYCFER